LENINQCAAYILLDQWEMTEMELIKNRNNYWKILILVLTTTITLAIHYGWVLQPIFGHANWIHAIHGRLCYIPIVIAASWFGLRGGLWMALTISVLVLPYIFIFGGQHVDISSELLEIVFYFAIAVLMGALVDREAKIRRENERSQIQLERSHKLSMIGQMASGVAHEIKNPLASIKGAFEILSADDSTPAEKREFQEIVFKEIKRMDNTVKEFLDFSRTRRFQLKKTNLSEILKTALRQFQSQFEKAGFEIDARIAENVYVNADPEKIQQVIINLILNAMEASRNAGYIKIQLNGDANEVRLVFEDSGLGFSDNDREKIFEPFYTTKAKGLGLGLAIVKSIIERHEGTILIESKQGEGAKFTVSLPAYKDS